MVPYWLKPNRVGVAFLAIFTFLLFCFFSFFVMTPCHWFWYFSLVTLPFVSYPIFMILGRNIENRRKLKPGQSGIEPKVDNRQLEWFAFIAFLIIVAIPLDLGYLPLNRASYSYFTPPANIVPPRLIDCWPSYAFPIILSIVLMILKWNTAFVIILTTAILLERFCAELAFHTLGGIIHEMYHFAVWLNVIPMILYAVKFRRVAVTITLALALLITPYQLFLGCRLVQLQKEAQDIVHYAYETKAQTGSYPKDLSGYEFKNPHLEKHVQRYESRVNSFKLVYFVGTRGTSHWYDSEDGWHYYPD